jgi:hypothetical protein
VRGASFAIVGELEGIPRIVVEVDNGRAAFCPELRAASGTGTVGGGKDSKEG